MKVMHLITGLDTGGAEKMLERLIPALGLETMVVSLRPIGPVGESIRAAGTDVRDLGMAAGAPDPRGILRLVGLIRKFRPDVLQTWMYHADLLGGLCGRLAGGVPVVWNIRQSAVLRSELRTGTLATIRLCAAASRLLPERIVSCSRTGAESHAELGYDRRKMVVIPNGFDTQRFRPDAAARDRLRAELRLSPDAPIVGLVARFDSQKDLQTMVLAAKLSSDRLQTHFVLCGDGLDPTNLMLGSWIAEAGLEARFHLLGRREDIPQIMAGFDVATSSSIQEGFPNAVGEAMACGVPCVVTDAGDSAYLLGEGGSVVPTRDPQALADAWLDLLQHSRQERVAIGLAGRQRIENRFSLASAANDYRALYASLGREPIAASVRPAPPAAQAERERSS